MSPAQLVQAALRRLGPNARSVSHRYAKELKERAAWALEAPFLGYRLKVYRNLHRNEWSLMATEGPQKGRVIGYASELWLSDPVLTVSEAGRQRAIREKQRNVHAFVVGTLGGPIPEQWRRVRYNPFRAGCFTDAMTGACVVAAKLAYLDPQGFLWMDAP